MHGLKKRTFTPEQIAVRKAKVSKYDKVVKEMFKRREAKEHTAETLGILSKVLSVNTDFYTMWNFRRQILLDLFTPENKKELSMSELKLTETTLGKSPKSYCVWNHRRWICENGEVDLANELQLCNKFLKLDSRNFHCWDYRRIIVKLSGVSLDKEFEYTTEKIKERFSNYSAWHYRSKLLPQLYTSPDSLMFIIDEEIEFLKSAFWTDPYDQSAWLYYRWILSLASINMDLRTDTAAFGVPELKVDMGEEWLFEQLSMLEEILHEEPECKWILLTKISLLKAKGFTPAEERTVKQTLEMLQTVDPMRKGYYQDLLAAQSST